MHTQSKQQTLKKAQRFAADWTDIMTARNPQTLMALPSEENFDFLFKIVLIGDCCTGKTSILQRFKTGNYVERHGNTIGVDFSMKTIEVEGKQVKVSEDHDPQT